MSRPGIHFAKLDKSSRLLRLLQVLRLVGSQGATTQQIIDWARVCAVNSAICELRRNGYVITCVFKGRNVRGSSVFRYTLIEGGK